MMTFALSVLASFIGGFLLALLGTQKNWIPFAKFKSTGVVKVFRNQENAMSSMLKDFRRSGILYVLAMKGETFSHPDKPFSEVLSNAAIEQRYLISSSGNPYLNKRAKELNMQMQQSVELSVQNFLDAQAKNPNIRIGRHRVVVRFRLILLTESLYLSFQEVNIPGKNSTILKIRKDCPMYKAFFSLFEDLWEDYGEA